MTKLLVLMSLFCCFPLALATDNRVVEGHEPLNESITSAHLKGSLSSRGVLSRDGYSESDGLVSITAKLIDFIVLDRDHVKYPNLESVKLSIQVAPLQKALATSTPDKELVKILVKGTVELFSGTKQDTEKMTCRLYNGRVASAHDFNADRVLECWVETDETGLDTPRFKFDFAGTDLSKRHRGH